MNYRHIYHAGNFADVFKHVVLMLCLEYLGKKDKPYFTLDTHAGIGHYDLSSDQAQKTDEAGAGIQKLWAVRNDAPDAVRRYLSIVRQFNRGKTLRVYPGSPCIMRALLRTGDRMIANELHPDDVRALRQALGGDDRVKVMHMDAYQVWKAHMPPPERRGIVLVDPPFEDRGEFDALTKGLHEAHKRWATGMYALWYPIKDEDAVAAFHEAVRALSIPDCRALDFYRGDAAGDSALKGCGLVIVNAPYTLADDMKDIEPFLIEQMTGGQGRFTVKAISDEIGA